MSSPYKFHKSEKEAYYSFTSANNITYRCFFTQKTESGNSLLGLTLKNHVIYFSFYKSKKSDPVVYDRRIGFTFAEILNRFFDKIPDSIISYICDDQDYKAIKRQNHFIKWFSTHNKTPKKTLIKAEIHDIIYAGAIMLAEHSEKKENRKILLQRT